MKKFTTIAAAALLAVTATFGVTSCKKDKDSGSDSTSANKTGTPPAFTYLYNTGSGHQTIGEYLQGALKTAGLTLNLENQEWKTFLNTRKDGNYTIARNGWLADYSDPICFLDMWTTNSGNNDVQFGKGAHKDLKMYNLDLTKFGGSKVENATWAETYDVLIDKINKEQDNDKRYEMMHMAEDMLMDTGCIVPLYFYTDIYMINQSVSGFYSNPLGYKYFQKTTVNGSGEKIDVCIASEPDSIDPAKNSAVDGATMLAHLFSGLAKWDQNPSTGKLEIVADAATELGAGVANSDGTTTYTYTLKDNTWSNGEKVTAADYVYSWKRAASKTLGADYEYMFGPIKGYGEADVDGLAPLAVEAVDEKTLKVTLTTDVAYWEELLAFPVYFPVYKNVVSSDSWATDPSTYVSNGAYKLTEWNHNSSITLEKRDDYYDASSVTMKKIVFNLSDDDNAMLTNYKSGAWQLIDSVPTAEISTLKKDYPNEFKVAGQIGTYYLCWNINADILPKDSSLTGVEKEKAQAEIRKAISLLLDRNYIVEEIGKAGQVAASSFVAMGMTNPDGTEFYKTAGHNDGYVGYYDVSEDAYESNCKEALSILKKYYTL